MGIVLRPYMWSALLKSLQQSLLLHSLFLGLHFFRQAAIIDVKVLIIFFLEIDVGWSNCRFAFTSVLEIDGWSNCKFAFTSVLEIDGWSNCRFMFISAASASSADPSFASPAPLWTLGHQLAPYWACFMEMNERNWKTVSLFNFWLLILLQIVWIHWDINTWIQFGNWGTFDQISRVFLLSRHPLRDTKNAGENKSGKSHPGKKADTLTNHKKCGDPGTCWESHPRIERRQVSNVSILLKSYVVIVHVEITLKNLDSLRCITLT